MSHEIELAELVDRIKQFGAKEERERILRLIDNDIRENDMYVQNFYGLHRAKELINVSGDSNE